MRYPVLETDNLFLRKPLPQDFPSQRPGTSGWQGLVPVLGHWDTHGFGPFALICKNTDLCLGLAGPYAPAGWPEGELVCHFWDSGRDGDFAREATLATREFAAGHLGWRGCVSYVGFANRAAIALAEALGAVRDRFAETPTGRDCFVYRFESLRAA